MNLHSLWHRRCSWWYWYWYWYCYRYRYWGCCLDDWDLNLLLLTHTVYRIPTVPTDVFLVLMIHVHPMTMFLHLFRIIIIIIIIMTLRLGRDSLYWVLIHCDSIVAHDNDTDTDTTFTIADNVPDTGTNTNTDTAKLILQVAVRHKRSVSGITACILIRSW